jgi:hypothetical protein
LLRSIPDAPAWIELRSELLAGVAAEVDNTGAVVRGISFPLPFVIGEPGARLILDAIERFPSVDLLAPSESRPARYRMRGAAQLFFAAICRRASRREGTRSFE